MTQEPLLPHPVDIFQRRIHTLLLEVQADEHAVKIMPVTKRCNALLLQHELITKHCTAICGSALTPWRLQDKGQVQAQARAALHETLLCGNFGIEIPTPEDIPLLSGEQR